MYIYNMNLSYQTHDLTCFMHYMDEAKQPHLVEQILYACWHLCPTNTIFGNNVFLLNIYGKNCQHQVNTSLYTYDICICIHTYINT